MLHVNHPEVIAMARLLFITDLEALRMLREDEIRRNYAIRNPAMILVERK